MSTRFTEKAQNVLNLSLQIASEMGHTYIGSEHLLMALLMEDSSVAAHFLTEGGANADKIQNEILQMAGAGSKTNLSAADMTPRTKSIIEASLYEAQRNGQNYIGTEHLLMALLNERDCVAVRVLEQSGVSINDLRSALSAHLGASPSDGGDGAKFGEKSKSAGEKSGLDATPTLKSFGRDLWIKARLFKILPKQERSTLSSAEIPKPSV